MSDYLLAVAQLGVHDEQDASADSLRPVRTLGDLGAQAKEASMSDLVGVRIKDFSELDDSKVCYFKDAGAWYLYLPGCGLANLNAHAIEEHPDGTISVTPSILVIAHDAGKRMERHGYFTKGVWREC